MDNFHPSVEIARNLSTKSPLQCHTINHSKERHTFPLQRSEPRAIFTDRWTSCDFFTDECFSQIVKPLFVMFRAMDELEFARFYTNEIPLIARSYPVPTTATSSFWDTHSDGRFSPIGGSRSIFTDEFSPHRQSMILYRWLSHIHFALVRAMVVIHRSV